MASRYLERPEAFIRKALELLASERYLEGMGLMALYKLANP
jgi:hypothetical protein